MKMKSIPAFFVVFSAILFGCAEHPEIPVQVLSANADGKAPASALRGQDAPLAKASREGVSFEEKSQDRILDFYREDFSFRLPGEDWDVVSDPSDLTAPLEFFNAKTGRRAEILSIRLAPGESPDVMDRARAEMQGRGISLRSVSFADVFPREEQGMTGAFFETAGRSSDSYLSTDGFVASAGGRVFFLSLSAQDSTDRTAFEKEWKEFFAGFALSEALKNSASEKEFSKETVTHYESKSLGYVFESKDSLWHNWESVAAQNGDPDLVLANMSEETAFFVYGTIVDPGEVSAQDLFKVLLIRLGVNPDDPSLETTRVRGGNAEKFVQNFTCERVIDGYDFKYVGRYFWDGGRGILVAGWAQGILYKKYAKILERAIDGVSLLEKPESLADEKSRKFQAAVVTRSGFCVLRMGSPLSRSPTLKRRTGWIRPSLSISSTAASCTR